MKLGTIALDIDGTITNAHHQLSTKVISYLTDLHTKGWAMIFLTGREFNYANEALSPLSFPYYLAAQNGADLVEMGSKRHIKSVYFDQEHIGDIEKLFADLNHDFLLYAGYERGDFCYYRPERHLPEFLPFLKKMQQRTKAPWKVVKEFPIQEQVLFPMIKGIGHEDQMQHVLDGVADLPFHSVMIKDSSPNPYYYFLATHRDATKSHALKYFMENSSFGEMKLQKPLIVAGDDHNDFGSLLLADVKVVMEDSPQVLKEIADVIAPLSINNGIIDGLKAAFKRLGKE